MDIVAQGNTGLRRPHVEATHSDSVSGAYFESDAIPLKYCTSGVLSLIWTDFNDTDAVAHVQGSYDGVLWNDIDGDGCTMDAAEDVQLWEFYTLTVLYLRVRIVYNSVTDGDFAVQFRGEFNSPKNY